MSITALGAFVLGYELLALATGLPTWTTLFARRSPLAMPVVTFAVWLPAHLALARG